MPSRSGRARWCTKTVRGWKGYTHACEGSSMHTWMCAYIHFVWRQPHAFMHDRACMHTHKQELLQLYSHTCVGMIALLCTYMSGHDLACMHKDLWEWSCLYTHTPGGLPCGWYSINTHRNSGHKHSTHMAEQVMTSLTSSTSLCCSCCPCHSHENKAIDLNTVFLQGLEKKCFLCCINAHDCWFGLHFCMIIPAVQLKDTHNMHIFGDLGLGAHGNNQESPWNSHILAQTASKGTAMQEPGKNAKTFGLSHVVHKHWELKGFRKTWCSGQDLITAWTAKIRYLPDTCTHDRAYVCIQMWICSLLCLHICTQMCGHDRAYVCMYVQAWSRLFVHVCMQAWSCLCVHIHRGMITPMCEYTCRHDCTWVCIYACRHDCAYVCVFVGAW